MLYDEYASYVKKYSQEYNKFVVLYECGSFFELYDDGSQTTNIKEIGDLLNIVVSRRNKAILEVSRNNPEMAGFPSHSLKKFLSILLNANYTIILVTQVTPPPNPKRAVTEILSPGTCLEVTTKDTNNLMVIYADETEQYKSTVKHLTLGIAIIDLTTGKSYIYETSSYDRDASYPYDEAYRLISSYNPKELEITSTIPISSAQLLEFAPQHNRLGRLERALLKPAYQVAILKKAYPETGLLTPIEFLDLERKPAALVAFTRLLQFAYEHNESVLLQIKKPHHISEERHLQITSNAAQQLDVNALLDLLNNTKTAIGKRYFKHRILNPYLDPLKILALYEKQSCVNFEETRKQLAKIYDIERLFRRVQLQIIYPHELFALFESLVVMNDLESFEGYNEIKKLSEKLNMEALAAGDIKKAFKNHDEIYKLNKDLEHFINHFTRICEIWPCFKVEQTDKDGYYLTSTLKRMHEIKNNNEFQIDDFVYNFKDFSTKALTNQVKVYHVNFKTLNDSIDLIKVRLEKLANLHFKEILGELASYSNTITKVVKIIQDLDYITTLAYNNNKYKLTRPVIHDRESSINAKNLRHLIVESNQSHLQYVPNDIELVGNGMLLYGINGSGKSCFMKSIGLAIIMVQSGMYAPAESFEYMPYTKIFTRITTCDDILRGQSTFTKEVLELRNIMNRADSRSLVIGDELCSGTESVSALSIVSAGIITLSARKTAFVFATHLHDLTEIPQIANIKELKVAHCAVEYDESRGCLVYDRRLKPGNGSSLYGIEVCKSLDMPNDFLILANEIRQSLTGITPSIIKPKPSHYNQNVFVDVCAICKTQASEVHHINEQQLAVDNYIKNFHKNSEFNLVALCEECHNKVHNSKLEIKGYAQTSKGPTLIVENLLEKQYPSKDEINEYVKNNKTKQQAFLELQKKYSLTYYKFNKILNGR